MSVLHLVSLALPLLENDDLFMAALLNDLGNHFRAVNLGLADCNGFAVNHQKNFRQLYRVANFTLKLLNAKRITGLYLVLFTAGPNYCIHATPPLYPQIYNGQWK
jgi:hypothetical protein